MIAKGILTVCGGGNSTLITAVLAKTVGWKVAILTRKPESYNGKATVL